MDEHAEHNMAPVNPAPPIPSYPQFYEVSIPIGSGASRAFRGYIRPFSDDANSHRVLRALEADRPLNVFEGRLESVATDLPRHRIEDYLVEMAIPCTVVVLEFQGKRHPEAYLLDPTTIRGRTGSQHVWWDKAILVDCKRVAQLCVYSGNLFKYDTTAERLPQFLNQLATYLAKHLTFLKTRMLHIKTRDGKVKLVKLRLPSEPIKTDSLVLSSKYILFGMWVGRSAPHSYLEHLKTVDPDGECWCNIGETYRTCHRPAELRLAVRAGHPAQAFEWRG